MTNARIEANQLADLLARERVAMAEFLVALSDFDRRKVWIDLGHSSLFCFLHRDLRLSAGSAQYRKTAAELLQKYPEVIEPLRDGRLCLTTIVELAKVLTPENCREVLPRFFHQSRREAAFLAAALQPETAPPNRDVVTSTVAVPSRTDRDPDRAARCPDASVLFQPVEIDRSVASRAEPGSIASSPIRPATSPPRRDGADPLTAESARLHITVSKRFLQKLEQARTALSHSDPGANAERILEVGLDLILKRHERRRGLVKKPQQRPQKLHPTQGANDPRQPSGGIPVENSGNMTAAVMREVWLRDGGRCQWPLEGGGTCGSTLRVEFDHSLVRAFGGQATVENLRLLCRMHNDLAARHVFGDTWMNQFTRNPRASRGGEVGRAQQGPSPRARVPARQTTIGEPSG